MVVFNSGLNEFSRRYLIANDSPEPTRADTFTSSYEKCKADIIEQLLLYDKVSIKVYGENIPLAILINTLGVPQVLELIDEGSLEFLLWTPVLTTMNDDSLIGKVMPIQSGNLDSPTHCDPRESVAAGMKFLLKQPERKVRRDLEKKVAKCYRLPKKEFANKSADLVTSAYSSNKLEEFGLTNKKNIQYLNREERFKLLSLGDGILETAVLADFQYSGFGNSLYYSIVRQSVSEMKDATKLLNAFEDIVKTENLPNVHQLLTNSKIDLKQFVDLRRKGVSTQFRAWLENISSQSDSTYNTKQYIQEITNHKGVLETNKGKFVKTILMYSLGAVVGSLAGGMPGTIAGVSASKILEPAADLGLDFLDAYLLDGILKGWHPKMFIDEYEKIAKTSEKESVK